VQDQLRQPHAAAAQAGEHPSREGAAGRGHLRRTRLAREDGLVGVEIVAAIDVGVADRPAEAMQIRAQIDDVDRRDPEPD
jgi:hypothetical protein